MSIRARLPIYEKKTYLNSCSYGVLSVDVRDVHQRYLDDWNESGSDWNKWVGLYETARASFAGLIVLRENPLERIRNTRSIALVMKNGILYSGEDASHIYPDPRPSGVMYFKR